MFDIKNILTILSQHPNEGADFQPSDVHLSTSFHSPEKEAQEEYTEVDLSTEMTLRPIKPEYPRNVQVIAIDSTSFPLGEIPDGLVCATRASVIVKPSNAATQQLQSYGPFITAITNQNKDHLYKQLYTLVCNSALDLDAPDVGKMMDRIRNLLERYLQLMIVRNVKDSLILLDGSLVGATVANPMSLIREILDVGAANNNCIVAISKSTTLSLKGSRRNILSLLDGVEGPCYVGGIKKMIEQAERKYVGDIYVVKLTPYGEPFRLDIATNAPLPQSHILNMVAGLAGDYGYPEELKLAHST
ncbi:MAG: DNA double-strand break repair nuclease NurA, partial [Nitrososphaera sp.]